MNRTEQTILMLQLATMLIEASGVEDCFGQLMDLYTADRNELRELFIAFGDLVQENKELKAENAELLDKVDYLTTG